MERRASVRLWPACPVTVSQRRVAIEVAGLAVWAEALTETKLTDEQVPFPLSTPASAGRWIGAPSARIFPSAYIHSLTLIHICPLCPPVDVVDTVDMVDNAFSSFEFLRIHPFIYLYIYSLSAVIIFSLIQFCKIVLGRICKLHFIILHLQ